MKHTLLFLSCFIAFSTMAQKSYQTFLKEGMEYQNKGEYEKAVAAYNEALSDGPSAKVLLCRGESLVELGEYESASVDFERVLSLDKKNAKAYYYRGREKHRRNDVVGALEDYNNALKYKLFDDEDLFFLMAKAKMTLGDYPGAIKDLDYILAQNPFHQASLLARGFAWKNLKDYKGALLDYNKAIKLDPNCPTAYIQRGILKVELNDHKDAIVDLDKAIALNAQTDEVLFYRGLAKYKVGDKEGALADLNTSKKHGYLEAIAHIKTIEAEDKLEAKSR